MRLNLNIFNISDAFLADETSINNGKLRVNHNELRKLLEDDTRLSKVDIQLTIPGDKCRITRVSDVIEPRVKIGNYGQAYPGAPDKDGTVGRGETAVLRGTSVVISEYHRRGVQGRPATTTIDMWGKGAEIGPYGQTCNVVILGYPAEGASQEEYHLALKTAALKASAYLAEATTGSTPDQVEKYNLPLEVNSSGARSNLPGIVYIFQIISLQYEPLAGDPVLYGNNIGHALPTILHPNEVLDGAITAPYSSTFMDTYTIQNHPIIQELYNNHGKTLDFKGVIICNAPNNAPEYERTATIAANLAKWTLRADGAILTKCGGGAPELVMARTAQKCEQMGIKTAMAFLHMGLDTTEISAKASTIFSDIPELDAMVSMGSPMSSPSLSLEAAERVIGQPDGSEKGGPEILARQIRGSLSQLGDSRLKAVRY